MRHTLIAILLGATSLLLPGTGAAQLKVAVKASADDVDLRNRLESAIRSELRRISGIEVVVEGPRDFEVNGLGIGNATDFAVAFTSVEIGVGYVESQGDKSVGLRVLCDAYVISGTNADHLREGTTSFTAAFDTHCAEPRRQAQMKRSESKTP